MKRYGLKFFVLGIVLLAGFIGAAKFSHLFTIEEKNE